LDLGFLVDGEHRGGDRGTHIEPDQVADLFHQVRVGRHLEGVLAPGLEPEGPPDLSHRGVADLVLGRQAARRPVRGVGRCTLEGLDHDRFDHVVTDRAGRPGTGGVNEAVEATLGEAVAPLAHRHRIAAQLGRDLSVGGSPRRAGQHDLGSQRQRLGRRMPARPALERGAFLSAQVDLDGGASSTGHGVPPMLAYNTGPTRPNSENSRSANIYWCFNLPGH